MGTGGSLLKRRISVVGLGPERINPGDKEHNFRKAAALIPRLSHNRAK